MHHRRYRSTSTRRSRHVFTSLWLVLLFVIGPSAFAQDGIATPTPAPTVSVEMTEAPVEPVVEEVIIEPTPTEVIEETPSPVITEEVLPISTPVEEPPFIEETPTQEELPPEASDDLIVPLAVQDYCQMDINDDGDTNPFTYEFAAINVTGFDVFAWEISQAGTVITTSALQSFTHTFSTTGAYDVELICSFTADPQSVTLLGGITIANNPTSNFSLGPDADLTTPWVDGFAPFTVNAYNLSTNATSYYWEVAQMPVGAGPFAPVSTTDKDVVYTNTFLIPGIYRIQLTASDAGGGSSVFFLDLAVREVPPQATFTVDRTQGTAPMTVVITGALLPGSGPVAIWDWDFGGGVVQGAPDLNSAGPFTVLYSSDGIFDITLNYTGPVGPFGPGQTDVPSGSGTVMRQIGVFPDDEPVDSIFTWENQGNVSAGVVRVCFTNESTGPVTTSTWNFGDGTILIDNAPVVCHDFNVSGNSQNFVVQLEVTNGLPAPDTSTSNSTQTITVYQAPIANFTENNSSIFWGDTVNFTDTSSGEITSWAWDFDGDGVTDSIERHPQNIAIGTNSSNWMKLGAQTVRLTVTGPGGTSHIDRVIVVNPRPLTCDITGNLFVLPSASPQTYNSVVGNVNGRTLSYNWTLTGPSGVVATGTTANLTNVTFPLEGNYTLTYTVTSSHAQPPTGAVLPDGVSCVATKTINVTYPALDCQISGNLSPLPNGSNYNYTANVTEIPNLSSGRTLTYLWEYSEDGGATWATVLDTDANITLSFPTTNSNIRVRYTVTATPSNATCTETVSVNAQYPSLTCSISGSTTPRPFMATDTTGAATRTYTANVSNDAGRTLSYLWTATGPGGPHTGTGSTFVLPSSLWSDVGNSYTISLQVTATDTNETFNCNAANLSATFTVPNPTCALPTGDTTPTLGETVTYSAVVGSQVNNLYGRSATTTWAMETWNPALNGGLGGWDAPVTLGTGDSYTSAGNQITPPTFNTPSGRYRLTYTVNAVDPARDCSRSVEINTHGVGANYACEGWVTSSGLTNDYSPESGTANYIYSVYVDNTQLYNLNYQFVLVENGVEREIHQGTSALDHAPTPPYSFTVNGSVLGPIGNKTLRLYVSPAAGETGTTYSCPAMDQALVVGQYTVNFTVNNDANIAVGEEICFTNTSTISHGPAQTGLNYAWDLGTAGNSTGSQTTTTPHMAGDPLCVTFDAQGSYTVTLEGESTGFGTTQNQTFTVNVWNPQSFMINRIDSHIFVGNTVQFDVRNIENINNFTWRLYPSDSSGTHTGGQITSGTGTTFNRNITTAGWYNIVVEGQGPLGTTTASYTFQMMALDDIRAAFRPSQYAGLAPMYVCFTDRSVGNNIVSWEWDFGNGETLSYTNTNIPTEICTTYTNGGQTFPVTLNIRNTNNLVATAITPVRTYNLAESQSSFTIEPMGGSRYCFRSILGSGSTVTGWNFGDGNTAPASDYVCHDYGSAGEYLVTMTMSNGSIVREVTVTPGPVPSPSLNVTAVCSANRVATFTITNNGDSMNIDDQIRVSNASGLIQVLPINLAAGANTVINIPDQSGNVSITAVDNTLTGTTTTTCYYPPQVTVASTCSGSSLPVFTLTNLIDQQRPMSAAQVWEIRDSSNAVIATGSFQFVIGQETIQIFVPSGNNPYETYTFNSTGTVAGNLTDTEDCAETPTITISSICESPITFTLTNTSAHSMVISQSYTITSTEVGFTPIVGTFQLNAGQSTTITIPVVYDPYQSFNFVSNSFAANLDYTIDCTQPSLVATAVCASPVVFTVTNTGVAMLVAQLYTITSGGVVVNTGDIPALDAGDDFEITLTGLDPYAEYVFASSGFAGNITFTQTCDRPALDVTSICEYPIVFTITNNGGDMLETQGFTVVNENGETVLTGTIPALAQGASTTVTLTDIDPYGSNTFQTTGFAGTVSFEQPCEQPALVVTSTCAYPIVFTVTNNGGDIFTTQPITIVSSANETLLSDTLPLLAKGQSVTYSLGDVNPYISYTLSSTGFAGTVSFEQACEQPALRIVSECADPIAFTVTNDGGSMLLGQDYTIVNGEGAVVETGRLPLLSTGASITYTLHGFDPYAGYTFTTNGFGGNAEMSIECDRAVVIPTAAPGSLFTGLPSDELNWNAVPVCGFGCPEFEVYHTDETGNWNIFRIDSADQENRENDRRNLTFGTGPGVEDVSPSLSPNNEWIVFSSNRDGNWELYVASTDGDEDSIQRLTYNTIAKDTDPVWGPNNIVVFETTRHGQWDLYAIDMATGLEYRLTYGEGNSINASWSPDGSRLIFQSDRPDEAGRQNWQVYELVLATQTVTRLSDGIGIAVDPQYSNTGMSIVYRTYMAEGENSILMVMNPNGENSRPITRPEEDATNASWSPRDSYIAYQSDRDGDLDIYVYEVATGLTRHLTDNAIADYAPTWNCSETMVIFTSDIEGNPDIYELEVRPITNGPVLVEEDAYQLTFETFLDVYPLSFPVEENASREGQTNIGIFGEQTTFLSPDTALTRIDANPDSLQRDDWEAIFGCR